MPKNINTLRKLKLKKALLSPNYKSDAQALRDAGYSAVTAHSQVGRCKALKSVKEEVEKEIAMDNAELIERLRRILKLKLELEEAVFLDAQKIKNRKQRLQVLNKTKDAIADITKTLRLVEGDSTSKIEVSQAEKSSRFDRLRTFMAEPQQVDN